jgi:hypothetical protein
LSRGLEMRKEAPGSVLSSSPRLPEVALEVRFGDGLLGHIALPAKAALVARAVDGVAGGRGGVTARGTAQSRHQRSRHSKVAEVPWETGTER